MVTGSNLTFCRRATPQIHIWAKVAEVEELPTGADASHEVGLQFTDVADEDRQRLASMLVRTAGGQSSAATVDAEPAAPASGTRFAIERENDSAGCDNLA